MKVDDDEAHVCMGDKEVKAGDRVVLFKNVCYRGGRRVAEVYQRLRAPVSPPSASSAYCEKVRVGEGTVTRTFNEHYSLVKVDPGVPFEEGTIVEKE